MAAAKGNTNWFAVWVSIAVVIVLVALGALVVFLNNQATAPGEAPKADIVNAETGAISFGSGEETVDTYIDFMCPVCNQFEQSFGESLQTAAAEDRITLNIHPVSILNNRSQGTEYSSRSGGAMYCVAEKAPDATLTFMQLLFTNQPEEGSPGLDDGELAKLAEQAGAADAADCISDGTYAKFVDDQTALHQIPGTPVVEINGERLDNSEIATRLPQLLG